MGEEIIRYRSYARAGGNLGMINVRRLSENYNTMYVDRYTSSSQNLSWAPLPALPPPFLLEAIKQRDKRRFEKAAVQKKKKAVVPASRLKNSKPFTLWWNDPEFQRRSRVAKYKLYGAEGKMKISFKRGYRWIKNKCLEIVRNL